MNLQITLNVLPSEPSESLCLNLDYLKSNLKRFCDILGLKRNIIIGAYRFGPIKHWDIRNCLINGTG